jgi:lipopolysaccharide/colanic/teichoic acid biosynthesis glycosyltransferase/O-antigen/teichoic acid export membrane protein
LVDLTRVGRPGSRLDFTGLVDRATVSNLGAQGGALAAVAVASLLVARAGGPTVLGEYALLRVLPWLFGVVFSCGLPTATAFFLASDQRKNDQRRNRSLRPTLGLMTIGGSALGSLAWLASTEVIHMVFFKQMSVRLVAVMAVVVITQLVTVTTKGCCQGGADIGGANLIIVAEELWFVFVYPVVLVAFGNRGAGSVVLALIVSGILAAGTGIWRLARRGFFAEFGLPSASLAKRIAVYGARGQLGNMLWLTNLRFDFVLLGALAGPAVLGIYAVASKFAELMRLAPTAINYVLYPRFAKLGFERATAEKRRLLPQATLLTVLLTPFVALLAYVGPVLLYGSAFRGAVVPGEIIIIGLSIEGAAAVSSAYLLGVGRPGLNSIGMGVGTIITVVLDVILIPKYGALGGAVTSAITYVTTTLTLTYIAHRVARDGEAVPSDPGMPAPDSARRLNDGTYVVLHLDTNMRRAVDAVIAFFALLVTSPLLIGASVAVKVTSRGPVLYKQVRAGRSGQPFTMYKFRSMVCDAEAMGPLITGKADPRVTWVGALLRATKVDELPQLINILRGDMTLIGPRPEVPHFLQWYDAEELGLLHVRPGLTGPGQIYYTAMQASESAGSLDPEEAYVTSQLHPKLGVDLDYLRRRRLSVDMNILLQTAAVLFHRSRESSLSSAAQTQFE